MLSRRLITAIALVAGLSAYYTFVKNDQRFVAPLAIAILVGVVIYIFQHQIDWWWSKGRTIRVSPEMRNMLNQTSPFYRRLDETSKVKFETRMQRWIQSKDFIGKGLEDLPEDLKYVVATYPIMLTFFQEDFTFEGLDKIVFYPHPFLTPNQNEQVHILELEKEDGVFIFAVKHLMSGHVQPDRFYNIGLHAFSIALDHQYGFSFELEQEGIWEKLERVSTISKSKLEDYLGFSIDDPKPVIIHHFFTFGNRFKNVFPELSQSLENHFYEGRN